MLPAITLQSPHLTLEPLDEQHRERMRIAGPESAIWTLQPFNIHQGFDAYFDAMLGLRQDGSWLPFAVIAPDDQIVGQSCYLEYREVDRAVEIGGTWYSPSVQGTMINPAAKHLLLDHAFSNGVVRVQLKTDVRNARSRAAITKLGAVEEGVHRKHRILPDGTWRDSVYFSIIDDEWPAVQAGLRSRLSLLSHRRGNG
ncbi:RimJ/RimL family protein N-acetyltransferase [Sphingomonas sp. UYAg733]